MKKEDLLPINVEKILHKINFLDRFKILSLKFSAKDDKFVLDNKKVIEICFKNGINIKYSSSKKFHLSEKKQNFMFSFGFDIKYNSCDFGTSISNTSLGIFSSAPWHFYADLMDVNNNINRVCFTDYQELEEILREAFAIYEDFKTEVLKVDWEQ